MNIAPKCQALKSPDSPRFRLLTTVQTNDTLADNESERRIMDKANAEQHTKAATEAIEQMLESDFTLEDDGTMDTVIGCCLCDWEGRYNPNIGTLDGISDGGEEYTDEEVNYMRIMEAFEMALDDHWHD